MQPNSCKLDIAGLGHVKKTIQFYQLGSPNSKIAPEVILLLMAK